MNILVPYGILTVLCVAGYMPLSGEFVFDDVVAVVKNIGVNVKPTNFSAIFKNDFWGEHLLSENSHKSYRPLTTLMFHMERAYFGFSDAKHMKHINLLLHCINTLLLWKLLNGLKHFDRTLNNQTAALTSIIFAVHPVHTEVICAVVGRADLMFCLIYLLALHMTACNKDVHSSVAVTISILILTAVGMIFKETASTIPIAYLAFSYIRSKVFLLEWKLQIRTILRLQNIVILMFTLLLVVCRLAIQNFQVPQFKKADNPIASNQDFLTRVLTQNYVYALNVWILLCPQWLCFDWAFDCIKLITDFCDIRFATVLILYILITVIIFKCRKYPGFLLGLCFLVIPFIPALGIFKVGFVLAERILYVPSIGSCLIVAYSFVSMKDLIKTKCLVAAFNFVVLLILVTYLLRTRERASNWMTDFLLFKSALKVCPKNAKVHYNIARSATDNLDTKLALHHYHKAIELYPQYESALMNLGNLYRQIGNLTAAENYLRLSVKESPDLAVAWMNLGVVMMMNKNFSEAVISYENALKFRNNYALCHYNYGNLYLDQKLYSKAIQQWQEAININPKMTKAWINILTLLDNQGLHNDAIRLSEKALNILPNNTGIIFIRATVFGKLALYIEAETLYKVIIEIEPANFLFHTNLGVLYHRWKKYDSAITYYRRAIQIDPIKAETATKNLKQLLK